MLRKNEDFIDVAKNIANVAIANLPESVEDLLQLEMDGKKIGDIVDEQVAKIGEKIEVKKYEKVSAETVVAYNHAAETELVFWLQ